MFRQTSVSIAMFFLFAGVTTMAQEEFDSLEFIYIDNSQIDENDGLTPSMMAFLDKLVQRSVAEKGTKTVVFASDLLQPQYAETKQAIRGVLNDLRGRSTKYLFNIYKEKEFIRENLYQHEFKIHKNVKFHFFVSDYFCRDVLPNDEVSIGNLMLVNSFPAEVVKMLGLDEKNCEVHLYFPGTTGSVEKSDLINVIEYSTDPRFTSNIKKIIKNL